MKKSRPPLRHSELARLRVPGMDASVLAAIDAVEAAEAESMAPIRQRYASAAEREIDPFTTANAAIIPEN